MSTLQESKIISFTVKAYQRKLLSGKERKGIYVTIKDWENRETTGEIAPLPGRSLETFKEALENTLKLQKNFLSEEKEAFALLPSVMFGVSMCLYSLAKGKQVPDVAVTTLLMDPPKEPVRGPVKLKLADLSLEEAVAFYQKCISQEKNIRIDLERKWSLDKTLEFCSLVDTSKIVYIEDPVTNYSDLEVFYEKTNVTFAIDNFLFFQPPEKIKTLKGLHSIIVKPSLVGGIKECKYLKELFDPIPIVISSLFETEVGINHLKIIWSLLESDQPAGIDTLKFFAP